MPGKSEREQPYERLDRAMETRRLQLGLNWDQLAAKAGITATALRAIRRGKSRGRDKTRYDLNEALRWEPGTLDAVLDGSIDPDDARETERTPPDDDMPLTRGEFRLYLAVCQNPDAELPAAAVKKLRALGLDPARLKTRKHGKR